MPTLLITGANRGLGLELVKQFDARTWRIHACCRAPDEAGELRDIAAGPDGRVRVPALDVTDFDAIGSLANALGAEPIDVLFNNAGIMEVRQRPLDQQGEAQSFGSIDYEEWRQILRVNVLAPMRMAEVFAGNVAASERKTIVTMSSILGSIAMTDSCRWVGYRASKAAVNMMTRGLASDLRESGITAVCLHPGWVRTDMGGAGADLTPEESAHGIAEVVDGLTPDQSGRYLTYDGGELPW